MSKLVVANWKMNTTFEGAQDLARKVAQSRPEDVELVICPPSCFLQVVQPFCTEETSLGAQSCHAESRGAYTGDVSAEMLENIGVSYVLAGHSERRQHHHETNEDVKKQAEQALPHNITPIICVGESLEDRKAGKTLDVLGKQLDACLPKDTSIVIIAYEPIWAIGTGLTASLAEIEEVHAFIKEKTGLPVLYGGSVTDKNAKEIMGPDTVDGVLVGGASLKPDVFATILKAAE